MKIRRTFVDGIISIQTNEAGRLEKRGDPAGDPAPESASRWSVSPMKDLYKREIDVKTRETCHPKM